MDKPKTRRTRTPQHPAGVAGDASLLTTNSGERLRLVVVDDANLATVAGGRTALD